MNRFVIAVVAFLCVASVSAQFLSEKKNLQKFEGYFDFHYSDDSGEIYLEVDKLNTEFLYVHSLRTGLGSNDIGLDRGQLGGGEVVKFVKSGNKLLLIQPNLEFRASSTNALERRSIEEAFAKSVLYGFDIKERRGQTYVIDFTPFLMQDTHGVIDRLKAMKEGTYKLEASRSALWMERTKAFPDNVEFEAMLTYVGEPQGGKIRSVAPNSKSVSVIQHHSFVKLPEAGYIPRVFDPRCGSYPTAYMDYSSPIWEPITKRFVTRHRLEKKNPKAEVSQAKEPIIYYLDPGTPEPVRSALLEGASWWNQAFKAIGYEDAFQVKMLPPEADPMDVRYNVIQWVHRSTRGWSYGATITDPRTGEIIKGHVSLGSLRIRQDYMIAQALMNRPFAESDANVKPMMDMALARIRQLSAHEVGHTLGFAHNFAASTNDRASVMDYPHPTLSLKNGEVDFSDAYDTGIGEWDKVTVAYSYGDVPGGALETGYLSGLLDKAFASGMRYITDSDARAEGGAHAKAHLWDNGVQAEVELNNILKIRETAISNFSVDNIPNGQPYTSLEDVFVPLYFLHRYQTEAAVKLIGGMDYDYQVKGGQGTKQMRVATAEQKIALGELIKTISSKHLAIPKQTLDLFPPRAFGYGRDRESFSSSTGVAFDPLAAAATASEVTISLLLHPERLNRLVQQKAMEPKNLGVEEVIDAIISNTFWTSSKEPYEQAVIETVQYVALQQLLGAHSDPDVSLKAKSVISDRLATLESEWKEGNLYQRELARTYQAYKEDPDEFKIDKAPKIPDGSPIGMDCAGPNYNN